LKTLEKPARADALHPDLARTLRGLIARTRPRNIVETGTSDGLGATLALCEALVGNAISLDQFYSIEFNPAAYALACEHLAERSFQPHLLCGICLPQTAGSHQPEPDHTIPAPVDDLLGYVLRAFEGAPDLVLLDAGSPKALAELAYALSLIRARCYIVLKNFPGLHCPCLASLQSDLRLQILELSHEKLGFCIAQFDPA